MAQVIDFNPRVTELRERLFASNPVPRSAGSELLRMLTVAEPGNRREILDHQSGPEIRSLIEHFPGQVTALAGLPHELKILSSELVLHSHVSHLIDAFADREPRLVAAAKRLAEREAEATGRLRVRAVRIRRVANSIGTRIHQTVHEPWRAFAPDPQGSLAALSKPFLDSDGNEVRRQFLRLDPYGRDGGHAAEVLGDLATADRVVVYVPGMLNNLMTFREIRRNVEQLWQEMKDVEPQTNVAVIAWAEYAAMNWHHVTWKHRANIGARRLEKFLDSLELNVPTVGIGHSYGSVVMGLAAKMESRFENLVFLGSPGVAAKRAFDFGENVGVFFVDAANDSVTYLHRFGRDYHLGEFGATHLDPGNAVGHRSYFSSEPVGDIAKVALGRTSEIRTRQIPHDPIPPFPPIRSLIGEGAGDAWLFLLANVMNPGKSAGAAIADGVIATTGRVRQVIVRSRDSLEPLVANAVS